MRTVGFISWLTAAAVAMTLISCGDKELVVAEGARHQFKGDYTQIPRGRVAWNINKFIVLVGKWAFPIEEELTALIEEEFSLPYFEFVYDEHWDLGHGWSGDMK